MKLLRHTFLCAVQPGAPAECGWRHAGSAFRPGAKGDEEERASVDPSAGQSHDGIRFPRAWVVGIIVRMTRYEAYVKPGWQELGVAHVVVVRYRGDGSADFGMFLVDLLCLGVKDAAGDGGVMASDVREYLERHLAAGVREPIHPNCAKKMIEGALAYAGALGFAPHRDFRKARKVLSGLDASTCPTEFTYGRNGKPCYVRGSSDDGDRADRILARLQARCGPDGFTYVIPEDSMFDPSEPREALREFFEGLEEGAPSFFEVSGLITGMQLCPTALIPQKITDALWGAAGREWSDDREAMDFYGRLMAYWNYVADMIGDALAEDGRVARQIVDVWTDDFEPGEMATHELVAALILWARGFIRATTEWSGAWGDVLTRPDLAPHWAIINDWANFEDEASRERVFAKADAGQGLSFAAEVLALARALRSAKPME